MPRSLHPVQVVMLLTACAGCASTSDGRLTEFSRVASRDNGSTRRAEPLTRTTTIAPRHPLKSIFKRGPRTERFDPGGADVAERSGGSTADRDRMAAESTLITDLIESELRDATPAERDELRRELSGLDADLVRQILRIRRRSLDAQPKLAAKNSIRATKSTAGDSRTSAATRPNVDAELSPPPGKHTPPRLGMPTLAGLGIANPFSLTRSRNSDGHTPPPSNDSDDAEATNSGVVITSATDAGGLPVQQTGFTPPVPATTEIAVRRGDDSTPTTEPPSAASASWKDSLSKLVAQAEVEVQRLPPGASEIERQAYLDGHVQLRLLYLIAGQPQQALQAIPGIDPAEQEYWQQLMWGIATSLDSQTNPAAADRATHTIAQLAAAIQRLRQQAHLEIGNATFCHKISGFGNYERFAADRFSPGQPVLVYAELANFRSDITPEGLSRTQIGSTIEIVRPGEAEEVVDVIQFPVTEDLCRNQRRDYFHSYEITLPQRLTSGQHVLRLTVEDQLSKKKAVTTLNFEVQ
jgi:hypothetical protein